MGGVVFREEGRVSGDSWARPLLSNKPSITSHLRETNQQRQQLDLVAGTQGPPDGCGVTDQGLRQLFLWGWHHFWDWADTAVSLARCSLGRTDAGKACVRLTPETGAKPSEDTLEAAEPS